MMDGVRLRCRTEMQSEKCRSGIQQSLAECDFVDQMPRKMKQSVNSSAPGARLRWHFNKIPEIFQVYCYCQFIDCIHFECDAKKLSLVFFSLSLSPSFSLSLIPFRFCCFWFNFCLWAFHTFVAALLFFLTRLYYFVFLFLSPVRIYLSQRALHTIQHILCSDWIGTVSFHSFPIFVFIDIFDGTAFGAHWLRSWMNRTRRYLLYRNAIIHLNVSHSAVQSVNRHLLRYWHVILCKSFKYAAVETDFALFAKKNSKTKAFPLAAIALLIIRYFMEVKSKCILWLSSHLPLLLGVVHDRPVMSDRWMFAEDIQTSSIKNRKI